VKGIGQGDVDMISKANYEIIAQKLLSVDGLDAFAAWISDTELRDQTTKGLNTRTDDKLTLSEKKHEAKLNRVHEILGSGKGIETIKNVGPNNSSVEINHNTGTIKETYWNNETKEKEENPISGQDFMDLYFYGGMPVNFEKTFGKYKLGGKWRSTFQDMKNTDWSVAKK